MHLEGDGLLGYEVYYMIHVLLKKKYFTLEQLNHRISKAPMSLWKDGVTIRPMHSSVMKGTKNGRCVLWDAAVRTHLLIDFACLMLHAMVFRLYIGAM